MAWTDYGWVDETNPLGPPSSPPGTPLNRVDLNNFGQYIYGLAEARAAELISAITPESGGSATYYNVMEDTTNVVNNAGANAGTNVTSLQAIINAQHSAHTIFIPSGTYAINAPLEFPSNLHLILERGAKLLATADMGQMLINAATTTGNSNITMEGGEVDAAGHTTNGVIRIVATGANRCNNIQFRGVDVHDSSHQGIKFNGVSFSRVEGCRVYNNDGDGITLYNSNENIIIARNHVYNCGDDDIAINSSLNDNGTEMSSRVAVTGNVVGWEGGETGIAFGGGQNIAVRGGEDIAIVGNVCTRTFGTGILLGNGDQGQRGGACAIPLSGVTVVGNTVKEAGYLSAAAKGIGIGLICFGTCSQSVRRIVIANNTVVNTRGDAIHLNTWSGQGTNGNDITDIKIIGNELVWDAARVIGTGTNQTSADAAGIGFEHHDITGTDHVIQHCQIMGNTIRNPPGIGIDIGHSGSGLGANTKQTKVSGNTVIQSRTTNNTGVGIFASNTIDTKLTDNECYDMKGTPTMPYGIDAQSMTGSAIIADNDCTWGGGAATATIRTGTASLTFARFHHNPGLSDATKG